LAKLSVTAAVISADPDDFGAHAAPQTAKHCSGHQATPHEQTRCLSGWFFGTDGDDCLGALLQIGVLPDEFVLWNAFPWHSFDPRRGPLSNRMPNKSEQLSGRPVLKDFLELFPCEQNRRARKNRRRAARATWC